MPRDIDQLIAALRRAHPELSAEQQRAAPAGADDDGRWTVRHPRALTDVQVESSTGGLPFFIESELAPPTRARTLDEATRLVIARLGLLAGG